MLDFKYCKKLKIKKSASQMFYEEVNALDMFVRLRGYTQCVLVSTSERTHNFWLFAGKL